MVRNTNKNTTIQKIEVLRYCYVTIAHLSSQKLHLVTYTEVEIHSLERCSN